MNAARSVIVFASNEGTGKRVYQQKKNNEGERIGAYYYAIEPVDLVLALESAP